MRSSVRQSVNFLENILKFGLKFKDNKWALTDKARSHERKIYENQSK